MDAISEGATSFLITEYKYMGVFMVGWRGIERERGLEGGRVSDLPSRAAWPLSPL